MAGNYNNSAHTTPSYLPFQAENPELENKYSLVEAYFHLGLGYPEIVAFLGLWHGIRLSLRHLKRILRRRGLRRRCAHSDGNDIVSAIESELKGSGSSIGYRLMHQRLIIDYALNVDRETVRLVLRTLDPEGVDLRSKKRLKRREYYAKGPDFIWHIDGYDKLKPFGFCIHGAIDGYSRRLLWLKVGVTNNDPHIIAKYYLDYIHCHGSTAAVIRGDQGTENVHVARIQKYLRADDSDSFGGEKSFLVGRSVSNQRIEAWWSYFRRNETNWWINYFKDLRDQGLFSGCDPVQVECLKFCYLPLIQQELDHVVLHWNLHRIRPNPNRETPPGRPDVLYFLPEIKGTTNCGQLVNMTDIEDILEEVGKHENSAVTCANEFAELAELIMEDHALTSPKSASEAFSLYRTLVSEVNSL
jgi:hypothetical protein